jgi:hypothetical protein
MRVTIVASFREFRLPGRVAPSIRNVTANLRLHLLIGCRSTQKSRPHSSTRSVIALGQGVSVSDNDETPISEVEVLVLDVRNIFTSIRVQHRPNLVDENKKAIRFAFFATVFIF